MNSTRIEAGFRRLAVAMVAASALLGLTNLQATSGRWVALGLGLHLLPAVMQIPRSLRVAGAWLAVFLVIQAAASLALSGFETHTLAPNLSRTIDIPAGTLPGLSGRQVLTTDGMGFRVTRRIEYGHKPPDSLRILVIGGSTTEQSLLDDRRTWTHLLQEQLQSRYPERVVEVINAGSSGTRAEHHLVTLRAAAAIHPDAVVFLMGINDWNKHIREHYGSRAFGPVQRTVWQLQLENTILGRALRRALDALNRAVGGSATAGVDQMSGVIASLSRPDVRTLALRSVAPDYASVVDQIIAECGRQRTFCVFVTQPHAYREGASRQLRQRFWMTPPFEAYTLDLESLAAVAGTYNAYLLDVARDQGLGACDLAAKMSTTLDGFYDDCHFNELGARAAAVAVASCLVDGEARLGLPAR